VTGLGIQSFVAVVVVLGLVATLAWLLRRGAFGPLRAGSRAITVETAVPLGERRSLVIVAVEGRRLLLGLTPAQISMVTELDAAAPAAPAAAGPGASTPSFEQLLVSRAKDMFRRTPPSASALRASADTPGQADVPARQAISPAGNILNLSVYAGQQDGLAAGLIV
jgi:flagellar biosynthetic protein FliO